MSIIYDALKKVHPKIEGDKESSSVPRRNLSKLRAILLILAVIILLFFIGVIFGKPSSKKIPSVSTIKTTDEVKPPIPQEPTPLPATEGGLFTPVKKIPTLTVAGIFFSDEQYIALINNQIVKAGDSIKGVSIDKIDFDGVDVTFEGSSFRLDYP